MECIVRHWQADLVKGLGKEVNHQSQLYVCVLYCYT
jgi:hypothetical protein